MRKVESRIYGKADIASGQQIYKIFAKKKRKREEERLTDIQKSHQSYTEKMTVFGGQVVVVVLVM